MRKHDGCYSLMEGIFNAARFAKVWLGFGEKNQKAKQPSRGDILTTNTGRFLAQERKCANLKEDVVGQKVTYHRLSPLEKAINNASTWLLEKAIIAFCFWQLNISSPDYLVFWVDNKAGSVRVGWSQTRRRHALQALQCLPGKPFSSSEEWMISFVKKCPMHNILIHLPLNVSPSYCRSTSICLAWNRFPLRRPRMRLAQPSCGFVRHPNVAHRC